MQGVCRFMQFVVQILRRVRFYADYTNFKQTLGKINAVLTYSFVHILFKFMHISCGIYAEIIQNSCKIYAQ